MTPHGRESAVRVEQSIWYQFLAKSTAFRLTSLYKRSIWCQLKENRKDERQVEASGIAIHVDGVVTGIRASTVLVNVMAKSPIRRRAMFPNEAGEKATVWIAEAIHM